MNNIKVISMLSKLHIKQFELNINYLSHNNSDFSIITPIEVIDQLKNQYTNIDFIDEREFGIDKNIIIQFFLKYAPKALHRVPWYFLQFVKLNYSNFYNNDYVTIDIDTILLKPISYIINGNYVFNLKTEHHIEYFDTIYRLLGNVNFANFSFISEYMIFNPVYVKELLLKIKGNNNLWYVNVLEKSADTTNMLEQKLNAGSFSEFETYGTYMYNNHRDKITFSNINSYRFGKSLYGHIPTYSEFKNNNLNFDTISFENWG